MPNLPNTLVEFFDPPAALGPTLIVVIDTEEEFDWDDPFDRGPAQLTNLAEIGRLQDVFEKHGITPCYVIDYPVATGGASVKALRACHEHGRCEIGAHMHPWLNPPFDEALSRPNSYAGNLPKTLERAKIARLLTAIEDGFGTRPTAYRAGRYGVGQDTFETLAELGITTDLSVAPHSDFGADGGPSFFGWQNRPYWAEKGAILGLPVTTGFSGCLRGFGPAHAPMLTSATFERLRLPSLLARSQLIERARLSPEGVSSQALKRLMRALVGDGERILTLSLHSSTLLPGATAYVRDEADRSVFLARIDETLGFFRDELGGGFMAISDLEACLRGNASICQRLTAVA